MKKKKKKKKKEKKYNKDPSNQNPCHPLFSGGIICGSHRGSFAVRDHLRSSLGIICGRGSFAALYVDHGSCKCPRGPGHEVLQTSLN